MGEEALQIVHLDAIAGPGGKVRLFHRFARRHPLQGGIDGGQDDQRRLALAALGKSRQGAHALGQNVGGGRHPVIGQAVPGGKADHLDIGCKERKRGLQMVEPLVITGDVEERARAAEPGDIAQHQPVEALRQPAKHRAPGRRHQARQSLLYSFHHRFP